VSIRAIPFRRAAVETAWLLAKPPQFFLKVLDALAGPYDSRDQVVEPVRLDQRGARRWRHQWDVAAVVGTVIHLRGLLGEPEVGGQRIRNLDAASKP
jgi:hypothetical protein